MKNVRNSSLTVVSVFLLAVVPFFSSCGSEPLPKPPVLEEARFVDFLADAYLLEGFYALESHYRFDTLQPEMIASYDTLLSTYGITREYFEHSMEWYSRHPEIFQRVHDTVLARFDREIAATPTQAQPIATEIKVTPSPFN